MSEVIVESTTDSVDDVTAATGSKKENVADKKAAAPEVSEAETKEKSALSQESEEDSNEPEDDAEGDEPEATEKPKKKNGFKRRIDRLNQRVSEREQRIAELEAKLAGRVEQEQPQAKAKDANQSQGDQEPDPDNFETPAEYLRAMARFEIDQREKKAKAESKQAETIKSEQAKINAHIERITKAKESIPDFDDLMDSVDDIPMSDTVKDAILDSENSAELMVALARDPEEYERICGLPEAAALRAIGRFEARLEKQANESTESEDEVEEKPKTTIKKSSAPPPMKPVGNKGTSVSKDLDSLDVDDFIRERNAQRKRK